MLDFQNVCHQIDILSKLSKTRKINFVKGHSFKEMKLSTFQKMFKDTNVHELPYLIIAPCLDTLNIDR